MRNFQVKKSLIFIFGKYFLMDYLQIVQFEYKAEGI
jgi:hypothetical protein